MNVDPLHDNVVGVAVQDRFWRPFVCVVVDIVVPWQKDECIVEAVRLFEGIVIPGVHRSTADKLKGADRKPPF